MTNRSIFSVIVLIFAVFGLFTTCGDPNKDDYVPSVPTYTVSFNANGGSPVPKSQTISQGDKVAEPAPMVYSNPNYGFYGWYKEQNGYYLGGKEWDFDTDTVTADITLYARWEYGSRTYTVNFEVNGGTPAPSQQYIASGSTVIMPPPMIKTGYGFDGWYKEEACINQWDFTIDTVTKNITLYAKWDSNYFTVSFEANGGTPAPSQQNIVNGRTVVTPPDMTKLGYSFGGWYKEMDCINQWEFATDTVTSNTVLYAKWVLPTIVPGANWNAKMRWLDTATNIQSSCTYIIEIDSDENISPITFSYSGKNNISITLKGIGSVRTLILSNTGSMFTVGSGVTLILDDNLELRGTSSDASLIRVNSGGNLILNHGVIITGSRVYYTSSYSSSYPYGGGVYVDGGTFIMNGGKIAGNTVFSTAPGRNVSQFSRGGGVYVGYIGTFTMNGGEISGNADSSSSSNSYGGGGVYVRGTFTMKGGKISDNTTSTGGGGVYVEYGTFFTMSGGEISGNTASSSGGGVYVASSSYDGSGTFTMSGGEISGNTASSSGGGVYVDRSIFNKTGGTIFGYSSGSSKSNAVKNGAGSALSNLGHAVHINHSNTIYIMGKDTTSGTGDNLSFNGTVTPPSYSGEWDY